MVPKLHILPPEDPTLVEIARQSEWERTKEVLGKTLLIAGIGGLVAWIICFLGWQMIVGLHNHLLAHH